MSLCWCWLMAHFKCTVLLTLYSRLDGRPHLKWAEIQSNKCQGFVFGMFLLLASFPALWYKSLWTVGTGGDRRHMLPVLQTVPQMHRLFEWIMARSPALQLWSLLTSLLALQGLYQPCDQQLAWDHREHIFYFTSIKSTEWYNVCEGCHLDQPEGVVRKMLRKSLYLFYILMSCILIISEMFPSMFKHKEICNLIKGLFAWCYSLQGNSRCFT